MRPSIGGAGTVADKKVMRGYRFRDRDLPDRCAGADSRGRAHLRCTRCRQPESHGEGVHRLRPRSSRGATSRSLLEARTGEPFATTRRAGDGILRVSRTGVITYASPNAVSIMRVAGVEGRRHGHARLRAARWRGGHSAGARCFRRHRRRDRGGGTRAQLSHPGASPATRSSWSRISPRHGGASVRSASWRRPSARCIIA